MRYSVCTNELELMDFPFLKAPCVVLDVCLAIIPAIIMQMQMGLQ